MTESLLNSLMWLWLDYNAFEQYFKICLLCRNYALLYPIMFSKSLRGKIKINVMNHANMIDLSR